MAVRLRLLTCARFRRWMPTVARFGGEDWPPDCRARGADLWRHGWQLAAATTERYFYSLQAPVIRGWLLPAPVLVLRKSTCPLTVF